MGAIQREFEVLLPIGFTDEKGKLHKRAVLRKMRGHEEQLLYDPSLTAGQLVTELIRSCLVRLGDIEPVDLGVVPQLFTADRNFLLLELRRITLGNQIHEVYRCPRCGGDVSLVEDLSEMEVHRLEEGQALADVTLTLEDGYLDRRGKSHTEITLVLPRGIDEEFVSPMVDKDPIKAHDALLLRCIKRFGTLPEAELEAYGMKILRDLTMGDRQRMQRAFDGEIPGVSFQRSIRCGPCQTEFQGVMDVSDFFVLG